MASTGAWGGLGHGKRGVPPSCCRSKPDDPDLKVEGGVGGAGGVGWGPEREGAGSCRLECGFHRNPGWG